MANKSEDLEPEPSETVTRRDLAKRLNVHMQTVTKWEREGLPIAQRGARGRASRYNEAAVRVWLTARENTGAAGGNEFRRAQAATANLREEQAKLAQLDYLRKSGTLVDAKAIEARIVDLFTLCRTRLLGIPSKAKFALPHLTHADVVAIENLVREALEDLATTTSDTGARSSSGGAAA